MGGLILLLGSALGIAFSLLVLRSGAQRRDNQWFAAMGLIDAAMSAYRGIVVLHGGSIAMTPVSNVCGIMALFLAAASLEFAYSFPFDRKPPRAFHIAVGAWTLGALLIPVVPALRPHAIQITNAFFFMPMFGVMLVLIARNYRKVTGDRTGARLVMIAIAFRWAFAQFTWTVARAVDLEFFTDVLWFEATAATSASFLLIGFAILRDKLFSIRGVVTELCIEVGMVLSGVLLTFTAIEGVLNADLGPIATRVLIFATTLVPLLFYVVAAKVRARLEAGLLPGVDPRRALRREVLDRVLLGGTANDPESVLAAVKSGLAEITQGAEVRYIKTADIPAPLAEALAAITTPYVHRERSHGVAPEAAASCANLPADLVVAVRTRGTLFGALVLNGGRLDRDSLLATTTLAEHLALKLENHALFAELEESRTLATLGQFAAAIAHDIRTPLTSVQMNVQILRGKSQAHLAADDMEYFDIALDELRRLNTHITEILDYAKPVQLHRAAADLRDIADDAARTLEPILAQRKLSLAQEHPNDLPPVHCDPQRIRQVLWNLLENAAKASPDGAAIELRTRRDGEKVAIDIVDTGCGIADGNLDRIFDPFFTTRPDGTGLGLAIVQKLVRAHSGEIVVRSQPALGSTFTILLPAAA